MRDITISELKVMIDRIHEQHPLARVDFVYPKRHGGKVRSALGNLTSYSVLLNITNTDRAIARFIIDWAREGGNIENADGGGGGGGDNSPLARKE